MKVFNNILDTIGHTPMIELKKIKEKYNLKGQIFAKLEMLNPSGSKKDRIAQYMIEEAEKIGILKKGQIVVEETSGNTGNALAMVCAVKGYRFVAFMSKGSSSERVKMLKGYGAEVILIDQTKESKTGEVSGADFQLVEEAARKFALENKAFLVDQFYNMNNTISHAKTTGQEIIEDLDGQIDCFLDFVGTGGSFAGVSAQLKNYNNKIICGVVEPTGSAIYKNGIVDGTKHKIQGGGYGKYMSILDKNLVDVSIEVSSEEASQMARVLAKEEGVFAGYSSGANVMAAVKYLQDNPKCKNVVVLINDTGLKYLSTPLFSND